MQWVTPFIFLSILVLSLFLFTPLQLEQETGTASEGTHGTAVVMTSKWFYKLLQEAVCFIDSSLAELVTAKVWSGQQ